jgi:hypothetical protein
LLRLAVPRSPAGVVAITYSALATGVLYVESFATSAAWLWVLGGLLLLSWLAGAAIGRWWAVLLPIAPTVLATPLEFFSTPPATVTELAMYGIPAGAIGVGVRKAAEQSRRDARRLSWRAVGLVLAYAAGVGVLMIYAASLGGDDEFATSIVVAFFAAQALVGFALGRWRALLLILLLPILAVPVPVPEDAYEPLPMWYAMLVLVGPLAALAMAAGIGLRKTTARLREAPRS